VPLAIWPVAQTTAQWERAGRYLPACTSHPGKMLPELARRIVTEYSKPGALVVDPLAGTGTCGCREPICPTHTLRGTPGATWQRRRSL